MQQEELGGYDPGGLRGVADVGKAVVSMTPVGTFNSAYTAATGRDAYDPSRSVQAGERVQAAGDAAAAILPFVGKAGSVAEDLAGAAGRAAEKVGTGSGNVYGTKVHTAFEQEVKALGNDTLKTEQSYLKGEPVKRGTPGSVRPDVIQGPAERPTAAYDLKTGNAKLTPGRVKELQQHLPGGSAVPVQEVTPP